MCYIIKFNLEITYKDYFLQNLEHLNPTIFQHTTCILSSSTKSRAVVDSQNIHRNA